MLRACVVAAILLVALTTGVAAQGVSAEARARAEQVLERYRALERAFDPAIADLYADDAVILTRRTYPNGEVRDLTIAAADYKALIRSTISLAKTSGDVSRYSDCSYAPDGVRVRIACARYSELKRYTSPIALVVGPGPGGAWRVFEERSESRP